MSRDFQNQNGVTLILFPMQEMVFTKDYYVIVKYAPRAACHRWPAGFSQWVGDTDAGLFASVSVFARVFNLEVCVPLFTLPNKRTSVNMSRDTSYLHRTLFFHLLSPSVQSKPAYCSGFGLGGRGYRQMGVHLPACSTSHGTNVTTQRALRLPQYHREITLARMNRFNSNGSPALFMHSQTPTSLKLHFFLGVTRRNVRGRVWHDNEGYEELMHFLHYWTSFDCKAVV